MFDEAKQKNYAKTVKRVSGYERLAERKSKVGKEYKDLLDDEEEDKF